jgi:formylmethanofuran dehydrogenase subunit D
MQTYLQRSFKKLSQIGDPKMKFLLNTVRLMENDQTKEYGLGDRDSLEEKLALTFLNPKDYESINPSNKPNLKISSKYGEVVVKGIEDEDVPEGTILMPISIWSNQLTGVEAAELIYKNISVDLEVTDQKLDDFNFILKKIRGT